MRILFTNNTFDRPAGTELSATDAIARLQARGHEPAAYSRQLGEVAGRIRALGVPVVDDFSDLPAGWTPDVIHGHHFWETGLAALRYPGTPVVSFCRGATPWQEAPCTAPNVVAHVAVDEDCRDRLIHLEGIAPGKITVVLNGVDPDRFPPRTPLPDRPVKALVFSNYAREDNYFATIRDACTARGIDCAGVGAGMGNAVSDAGALLAGYDLVFAKGKAALEALYTGCAVIVCDEPGIGDLVTPGNLDDLRRRSFGYSCMPDPISPETVGQRLDQWDRSPLQAAATLARDSISLDATVDALVEVYESAIQTWRRMPPPSPEAQLQWAARNFGVATHAFKLGRELQDWSRKRENGAGTGDTAGLTAELNRLLSIHRATDTRIGKLEARLAAREERIEELRERLRQTKESLEDRKKNRIWWPFRRK
jgi:glycosyltransferase involved in cell wall biosynthesis